MFRTNRGAVRAIAGLTTVTSLLGLAACGGDDSGSTATTAAAAATTAASTTAPATTTVPTTAAPPPTAAPTTATAPPAVQVDVDGFCQAELAAEAAATSEDPATAGPAFEALSAAAPPGIQPAVDAVIAAASSGDTESDEFNDSYATLISYVKDHCGFADLEVSTTEYAFGGVPSILDAGPVVITNTNVGDEFHEVLLLRVDDGVTESIEDIVALPEEEAMQKATVAGVAFAAPGTSGYSAVDLAPGHYAAICFLPQGATPEHMEAIQAGEFDGAPHFTLGMLSEFDVR